VSNDEIVSGCEYAKDQYVEIDPSDLAELRSEDNRTISANTFVPPSTSFAIRSSFDLRGE